MNIYIDESGSINNKLKSNKNFIITLLVPTNEKLLKRAYKRFISNNYEALKKIDKNHKLFLNDKFHELKGSQFDKPMKEKFVCFFSQNKHFEIYYIHIQNWLLTDTFCKNTSHLFNYAIRLALEYLITNNFIKSETMHLLLDERNEKIKNKSFLQNYLNTELTLSGITTTQFTASYHNSSTNHCIQIADVFSNLFYSHLLTKEYKKEIQLLKSKNILRCIYQFPSTS